MRRFLSLPVLIASVAAQSLGAAAQTPELPQPSPWQDVLPPLIGDDHRFPAVRGRGICATDYGWCPLVYPSLVPPNSPCYCMAGGQNIMGTTGPREYYGYVNPWFNPWR